MSVEQVRVGCDKESLISPAAYRKLEWGLQCETVDV